MLDKNPHAIGVRAEVISLVAIASLILVVSLALPQILPAKINQFVVGPIVNCALVAAALTFRRWWNVIAIICVPSVSAIMGGLVVLAAGNLTLLYMIPAIWVGNFALVSVFRLMNKEQETRSGLRFAATAAIAVCIKAGIIFAGAILISGGGAAQVLWTAMGIIQLVTATMGCILAYGVISLMQNQKKL